MASDDSHSRASETTDSGSGHVSRRGWMKAAGAAGVAGLAGCTGGGDGGGGDGGDGGDGTTVGDGQSMTTIQYWRWPHSTDPSNEGERVIVEDFNKGPGKEKNIKVEQVTTPYGDYTQKLKTAIGGNDAPAVGWGFPLRHYEPTGKPRSDIEQNAPFTYIDDLMSDEFKNQIFQPFWTWQQARYKGPVGVPFIGGLSPGLMYVNTDAWEAAGLGETPSGGWTIQEFHEALEALNGVEVNGSSMKALGVGMKDAISKQHWADQFLLARTHGSIIDHGYLNDDDQYVLHHANEAMEGALQNFYKTPVQNDWTINPMAFGYLELQEQFIEQQFAMFFNATFSRAQIGKEADFNWEVIPLPTLNGEDYWLYGLGGASVMFLAFKEEVGGNPDAGWEFIKFRNNARNHYKWFNVASQAVPNRGAYELMKEEGVSDFVKQSAGLALMDRVAKAAEQDSAVRKAFVDRFPNMKTQQTGGVTITEDSVPLQIASGRLHDQIGGMAQRLVQQDINVRDALVKNEETWAQLLQRDDLKVLQDSVGFNTPDPKLGPLDN